MDEHDMSWVRTEMTLAQAAPSSQAGPVAWVRKNLFASPFDSALTILAALAIAWALPQMLNWLIFNAVWSGADRTACLTIRPGRPIAGRLDRGLLALRQRPLRAVHVRPLPG